MVQQTNMQRDVLVLNLEQQLDEVAMDIFQKKVEDLGDHEVYFTVLELTKRLMNVSEQINGEKKIYYISAEFLIGKLLS